MCDLYDGAFNAVLSWKEFKTMICMARTSYFDKKLPKSDRRGSVLRTFAHACDVVLFHYFGLRSTNGLPKMAQQEILHLFRLFMIAKGELSRDDVLDCECQVHLVVSKKEIKAIWPHYHSKLAFWERDELLKPLVGDFDGVPYYDHDEFFYASRTAKNLEASARECNESRIRVLKERLSKADLIKVPFPNANGVRSGGETGTAAIQFSVRQLYNLKESRAT